MLTSRKVLVNAILLGVQKIRILKKIIRYKLRIPISKLTYLKLLSNVEKHARPSFVFHKLCTSMMTRAMLILMRHILGPYMSSKLDLIKKYTCKIIRLSMKKG